MRHVLLTVGEVREPYLREGVEEYARRLGRYARLDRLAVAEEPLPRRLRRAEATAVLAREGDRLLRALDGLGAGFHVVALDVQGVALSSEDLAGHLNDLALAGTGGVAWVVGGTLGLDDRLRRRADLRLSLSRLTFPHQMVPLLVLEQIYRAYRIMRGEPYHYGFPTGPST
ncbi:MAG TPA: 23S rRNA (pseudouridine(1915)-N(3))-methyltransferase RlmH [Bacillota bacterium]